MNKLRISGIHYEQLKKHLFPGDGKEAVAVALCGRSLYDDEQVLLVKELLLVPYDICHERREDFISWPTDVINPLLEKAAKDGSSLLKIHCHPTGYERFSDLDNQSDFNLFTSIHAYLNNEQPHASCIMLPDGRIFGRVFYSDIKPQTIKQISVAGDSILNWYYSGETELNEAMQIRNIQTFGLQTIQMLSKMRIGVVGCSGTGSPTIEQLKRLGVGELVLCDPDFIDTLNLNRIVGSTFEDAENKALKVDVMKREIEKTGFGTVVTTFASTTSHYEIIKKLTSCDVLFSCVDRAGVEARHHLSLISSYYIVPLFDMGVKLDADGKGGINGVFGSVHYIQPGGSSLLSRGQYDLEKLRSAGVKRLNMEEFERNQYLVEVEESSPAVITINMQVAATAVNEFLARIHPYRNVENSQMDVVSILFNDCVTYGKPLSESCSYFAKLVGKGDIEPLLNNPELSHVKATV